MFPTANQLCILDHFVTTNLLRTYVSVRYVIVQINADFFCHHIDCQSLNVLIDSEQ